MSTLLPSTDWLKGACAGKGISCLGNAQQLHERLGACLVKELEMQTTLPSTPMGGVKKRKLPSSFTSESPPRATPWQTFLTAERKRVIAAGFTGSDVITEIARRWNLHKKVGSTSAPLMLESTTSSCASSSPASEIEDFGLTTCMWT